MFVEKDAKLKKKRKTYIKANWTIRPNPEDRILKKTEDQILDEKTE